MSTNPVRLEWTEEDEREYLREQALIAQERREEFFKFYTLTHKTRYNLNSP
jgi:hypothetical protein